MKMQKLILINRATDPLAWYAERIGEIMVVEREENFRELRNEGVYLCREGGIYNPINFVRCSDATVVQQA